MASSMSSLTFRTISEVCYALLVLLAACAIGLSCVDLLAQAVRSSANRSWTSNFNALVIGASYIMVLVASLLFCINRRVSVRRKLQRISNRYRGVERRDVPQHVHEYISQEYTRSCLVSHASQPTDAYHEGWGRPGTDYDGIRFRRALLDTVKEIDTLAHLIVPSHPLLKPHTRMVHHFRFIISLLPIDEDGISLLHYYDSAIQLARTSSTEPTEREFEVGMEAANQIKRSLYETRLEMLQNPSTAKLEASPTLASP